MMHVRTKVAECVFVSVLNMTVRLHYFTILDTQIQVCGHG